MPFGSIPPLLLASLFHDGDAHHTISFLQLTATTLDCVYQQSVPRRGWNGDGANADGRLINMHQERGLDGGEGQCAFLLTFSTLSRDPRLVLRLQSKVRHRSFCMNKSVSGERP